MPMSAFIFIKTSGLLRTINVHVKCLGLLQQRNDYQGFLMQDTTQQTLKPPETMSIERAV